MSGRERPTRRIEADVVVVGGGGSGLAAAVAAAELGRKVILVEKNDALGGTTARSIGAVTAPNTSLQRRAGIQDSRRDYYEDFRRLNATRGIPDNDRLLRLLVDEVPATFAWLEGMGVVFHGPMPELPHRKPRMHTALPNSRAYIFHLSRRARRLGVSILTSTPARNVVIANGRVEGVVCESPEGPIEIRARATVLSTGDYSANPEMKKAYISETLAAVQPVNPLSTGDGHRIVTALGGNVLNRQLYLAGIRFIPPRLHWISKLPPHTFLMRLVRFGLTALPDWMLRPFVMSFITGIIVPSAKLFREGAILINQDGERFADESADLAIPLSQQPDQQGYILFDADVAKKFGAWPYYVSTAPGFTYAYVSDYRRGRKDIFREAATLGELAAKINVPPANLEASVNAYNESLRDERKNAPPPIVSGPFIALGPVRYYINFTDGGLAVSDRLQVLGPDDKPIEGLYAVGSVGQGGLLLEGHGHHLSWAFTSGRLAGAFAAEETVSADIAHPHE